MADYARIYETDNAGEVNAYIKKGWNLIDTSKSVQYDGDGSYMRYTLGLTTKEYANRLLAVIREYEKHGLKETLYEKVAGKQDEGGPDSVLGRLMVEYEDIVNDTKSFDLMNDPF